MKDPDVHNLPLRQYATKVRQELRKCKKEFETLLEVNELRLREIDKLKKQVLDLQDLIAENIKREP